MVVVVVVIVLQLFKYEGCLRSFRKQYNYLINQLNFLHNVCELQCTYSIVSASSISYIIEPPNKVLHGLSDVIVTQKLCAMQFFF